MAYLSLDYTKTLINCNPTFHYLGFTFCFTLEEKSQKTKEQVSFGKNSNNKTPVGSIHSGANAY